MKRVLFVLAIVWLGRGEAASWNVAAYFPNIQVITMDPESERFRRCAQELESVGLGPEKYEVVQGVDGASLPEELWMRMVAEDAKQAQGRMGCYLTHYAVIKQAKKRFELAKRSGDWRQIRKYRSVLIIEDNTAFGRVTGKRRATQKNYKKLFRKVIKQLPPNWDMLYFMSMKGDFNPVQRISSHIAKLSYGVVTKCYVIHSRFYNRVLAALEKRLQSGCVLEPVDNVIAELHRSSNCYVATPPLIYRFASASLVYGGNSLDPDSWSHWQSDAAK